MEKAYELLQVKGDQLGTEIIQDHELRDLLQKRNESILAHGQKPVSEDTYAKLLQKTMQYASQAVSDLHKKLNDSTFPTWAI